MTQSPMASRRKKAFNEYGGSASVVSPIFVRHTPSSQSPDESRPSFYNKHDKTTNGGASRSTASYNFLLGGQQRTASHVGARRISNKKNMSTALYRFWQRNFLHRATMASHGCSSSALSSSSRFLSSHQYQRRRQQQAIRLAAFLVLLVTGALLLILFVATFSSSSSSSTSRIGLLRRSASSAGQFQFADPILRHRQEQQNREKDSATVLPGTIFAQKLAWHRRELLHEGDSGHRFTALLRQWVRTVEDDDAKGKMKKQRPVFQTHFSFHLPEKKVLTNDLSQGKNNRQLPDQRYESAEEFVTGGVEEETDRRQQRQQEQLRQQLEEQLKSQRRQADDIQNEPVDGAHDIEQEVAALEQRKRQEKLRQQLEDQARVPKPEQPQHAHVDDDGSSNKAAENVSDKAKDRERLKKQERLRQQLE